MSQHRPTDDIRIKEVKELLPPITHLYELPVTPQVANLVYKTRHEISGLVHDRDSHLLVIIGPCSIHDTKATVEYAQELLPLHKKYEKELLIMIHVYFEKPHTTVGQKGLIDDLRLDGTSDINYDLHQVRQLLLTLSEMGMPASTEFLDMIIPQYCAGLISWGVIGARITESQVHRGLASGLSYPVGFKNGTDGNLKIAIDAIDAANHPHHFLSITKAGYSAIAYASGSPDCYVILCGDKEPSYSAEHVKDAVTQLQKAGISSKPMVDCNHANSRKDFHKQMDVARDVVAQLKADEENIMGVIVESHLVEGRRDRFKAYGQSIADACIGWDTTEELLALLVETRGYQT